MKTPTIRPDFKIMAAQDVPPDLASLAVSSLREGGKLFGITIRVSKDIPPGEVWIIAPEDDDDGPAVRLSNLSQVHDSITVDAVFKHPLKTIGMVLTRDKEDE